VCLPPSGCAATVTLAVTTLLIGLLITVACTSITQGSRREKEWPEVIVVDGGSTDTTVKEAHLQDAKVRPSNPLTMSGCSSMSAETSEAKRHCHGISHMPALQESAQYFAVVPKELGKLCESMKRFMP
jgi:hypothetical protein